MKLLTAFFLFLSTSSVVSSFPLEKSGPIHSKPFASKLCLMKVAPNDPVQRAVSPTVGKCGSYTAEQSSHSPPPLPQEHIQTSLDSNILG